MRSLQLLPYQYKKLGWALFMPSLLLGIFIIIFNDKFGGATISLPVIYDSGFLSDGGFFQKANVDWLNNLVGILIIVGGMLVGFSQEKNEDEYLSSLRLKAVFWSLLVTYAIVLLLFVTVFGIAFFNVMIITMYLPLILYIFRFQYLLNYEK